METSRRRRPSHAGERELRISVRLRDPVARQLEELCKRHARHGEDATYSEVLKTALERLHADKVA